MNIIKPSVELLCITPNAEKLIEQAARTCYRSEKRITSTSSAEFCKKLIRNKHLSQIEHATATFKIITDRGVLAELTRHRIASFSVQSTRYVNFKEGIDVIEPPEMDTMSHVQWENTMIFIEDTYRKMIENGCKPEIARSVLPMSLATEIIFSANFRELLHVIDLRTSKFSHPQIREIVEKMKNILTKEVPNIFGG